MEEVKKSDDNNSYVMVVQSNHVSRILDAVQGDDLDRLHHPNKKRQRSCRKCKFITVYNAISPIALPPHARQNICVAYHVPNRTETLNLAIMQACTALSEALALAAAAATTRTTTTTTSPPLKVRINSLPKALGETHIHIDETMVNGGITFELTRSASKADVVLSFVEIQESNDYRWGICDGSEAMKVSSALNHNAAREVNIGLINTTTGVDLHPEKTHASMPVSRAYFKMDELLHSGIVQRYITDGNNSSSSSGVLTRTGIDFGASPGGWTQSLRKTNTLTQVLSIDPGCIAERVMQLNGITHAKCNFTSNEAVQEIITLVQQQPLSLLVCDANIDPPKLLAAMEKCLQNVVANMNEQQQNLTTSSTTSSTTSTTATGGGNSRDIRRSDIFSSGGCVLLLTFKFPFKSSDNVHKHLKTILDMLPGWLSTFFGCRDEDNIQFEILYLHANSEAERTLVARYGGVGSGGGGDSC